MRRLILTHRLRILDSKASAREKDANGFLIIKNNPIAKAGVFEYLESEILPNSKSDKIVKVYRPFDKLQKAKDTFANKPIKFTHKWVGDAEPQADGAIGSNITADGESLMLKADLIIYNPKLIEAIENGECVELSPAYTGDIQKSAGRFNGSEYDYIQEVECVNHLAVVESGRSGKDLRILDSKNKELKMAQKIDLLSKVLKFLDSEPADEPKTQDGEGDEPKTADSKSEIAKAILEIAKADGADDEKIAKILEVLGTADSDEPKDEPKTQDSDDDKGDEPKTQDDDSSDDDDKAKDFADSLSKIIDSRVAKQIESYKIGLNRIQDSYDKVSKALGTSFDKSGMSADDIFKFGYESISGAKLDKGADAETAFNVVCKANKVVFKDSEPAKNADSKILKMLENL